ncbi:helix-turn-helix domain-containing protein [Paenochrobactrum pullorum]|uniref:helix-turn-helix domain-containing protein n=1 Tax=Paenochrobactrum pullorum TaxID=1324351 RepID=UPI0035BBBD5D
MNNDIRPLLLNYDDAAKKLGLSRPALRDLVYKRRGPATINIGRRTMFAYKDLEIWVDGLRKPAPQPANIDMPKRKRGRPSIADKMLRGEL